MFLRVGLPHNSAMDSDTVRSPLRAPHSARHRERWASQIK